MAEKTNKRKKDYIERAAGIGDNCTLTYFTLAISEHEEPLRTGEGKANNTPREGDIGPYDLGRNVIIKAENTERPIESGEKTVRE